jgi:DNA-directed RNA polymerase subunit N (RpoN/RPB10)
VTVAEIKAAVLHRDRLRCASCGMGWDEHWLRYGSRLEVHRVDPRQVLSPNNGLAFCKPCGSSWTRRWRKFASRAVRR